MRRQYLFWSIGVFGIVGTVYGAYSVIYNTTHKEKISIWAMILLILGLIALILFIIYVISYYLRHRKKKDEPLPPYEEPVEDTFEELEEKDEEVVEIEKPRPSTRRYDDVEYERRASYSVYDSSSSTIYVKQVGYGPILRFEGNRVLDMRTSTYYRREGNMVIQEGYGPVFEIRGNQIKDAFGGYLYELSGNNINKVFGGYYASISGNYITLYDLSVKYETTEALSKTQTLIAAALLFGKY